MPYVARPVYDVPDTPPLSKSARGPQTLGHDKRAQASLENEDFAANKVPRAQALRQASTNMSAASSSGSTRRTVTIAIDPGTTSTSVSYTIVGLREQPVCVTWGRDKSDAANYESPAIFHHKPRKSDGVLELLCGYELEEETRKQVVELEQVMSGLKVATLQHEDFSAQIRERIEEKVSNFGKTMADLWADYLDYLMKKTIDCIRRDTYFQANDRNTSDLILLIAQPNLSEPMDNTILVEAAQRIECTASYIVQEADCGATSVICEDKHLLQRVSISKTRVYDIYLTCTSLQLGDKLIVLDLGGGFCSPTAHEVRRDAKREGGFVLEPIASSNSRLAGSIFINQDFQNKLEYWMMQKNGETLEAQATALGYSVDGFKAKAAEHFEQRAKKLFPKDDTYDITVTSRYKKMRTCWSMELTRYTHSHYCHKSCIGADYLVGTISRSSSNTACGKAMGRSMSCSLNSQTSLDSK